MGIVNHNTVIATTWDKKTFGAALEWCRRNLPEHRYIWQDAEPALNGYRTLVLLPDGSKEGWSESDVGDAQRDTLIAALELDNYDDGSSPWEWVEVGFGEYGQKVLRGNNVNCFDDREYAAEKAPFPVKT